jgi:hypothetical protein
MRLDDLRAKAHASNAETGSSFPAPTDISRTTKTVISAHKITLTMFLSITKLLRPYALPHKVDSLQVLNGIICKKLFLLGHVEE